MLAPNVGVKLFWPNAGAGLAELPNTGVLFWLWEAPKTGVFDFAPPKTDGCPVWPAALPNTGALCGLDPNAGTEVFEAPKTGAEVEAAPNANTGPVVFCPKLNPLADDAGVLVWNGVAVAPIPEEPEPKVKADDPDGAPKAGADDVTVPKAGAAEDVVVPNEKPDEVTGFAPNWKGCEGAIVVAPVLAPKLKAPAGVPLDAPKANPVDACVAAGFPNAGRLVEPAPPNPNPLTVVAGVADVLPNMPGAALGCDVERFVPKLNPPELAVVVVEPCPKLIPVDAVLCPKGVTVVGACPKLNPVALDVVASPCPKLNPVALVVTEGACPKANPPVPETAVDCPKLGPDELGWLTGVCPKLNAALDVEGVCPKLNPALVAVVTAVVVEGVCPKLNPALVAIVEGVCPKLSPALVVVDGVCPKLNPGPVVDIVDGVCPKLSPAPVVDIVEGICPKLKSPAEVTLVVADDEAPNEKFAPVDPPVEVNANPPAALAEGAWVADDKPKPDGVVDVTEVALTGSEGWLTVSVFVWANPKLKFDELPVLTLGTEVTDEAVPTVLADAELTVEPNGYGGGAPSEVGWTTPVLAVGWLVAAVVKPKENPPGLVSESKIID